MSVNDEAEHPWLIAEKRLIRESVADGVPYWGSCLGVQLLASSMGARVYAGPQPEVGVLPVTLTDEGAADPVLQGLPREFPALQWHGDTFDLPDGAVLLGELSGLSESGIPPRQRLRCAVPPRGLRSMAREWAAVPAYTEYLERTLGPGSADRLFADFDASEVRMRAIGRRLFEQFVDAHVAAAAR